MLTALTAIIFLRVLMIYMEDNSYNVFDEANAVEFIRQSLSPEIRDIYSDDDILNIIDMIWDYYEDSGLLDITFDESDEDAPSSDFESLMSYVRKMLSRDKHAAVSADHLDAIVRGELAYERSIGLEE